jgi:hypothetical protein
MTPTNNRPEWACSKWDHQEHDWLLCAECIEAYEIMTEKAQDDWEEDTADAKSASMD